MRELEQEEGFDQRADPSGIEANLAYLDGRDDQAWDSEGEELEQDDDLYSDFDVQEWEQSELVRSLIISLIL